MASSIGNYIFETYKYEGDYAEAKSNAICSTNTTGVAFDQSSGTETYYIVGDYDYEEFVYRPIAIQDNLVFVIDPNDEDVNEFHAYVINNDVPTE